MSPPMADRTTDHSEKRLPWSARIGFAIGVACGLAFVLFCVSQANAQGPCRGECVCFKDDQSARCKQPISYPLTHPKFFGEASTDDAEKRTCRMQHDEARDVCFYLLGRNHGRDGR